MSFSAIPFNNIIHPEPETNSQVGGRTENMSDEQREYGPIPGNDVSSTQGNEQSGQHAANVGLGSSQQQVEMTVHTPNAEEISKETAEKDASVVVVKDETDTSSAGEEPAYADVTYMDILKQFSLLGWIAFGESVVQQNAPVEATPCNCSTSMAPCRTII